MYHRHKKYIHGFLSGCTDQTWLCTRAQRSPKHYAINILSDRQQDLSGRYARKGEHELDPAHYLPGDNGAPLITDALASFECDLHQTHDGGDHLIIVGRVTRMRNGEGGAPLVFYSGGYRELA